MPPKPKSPKSRSPSPSPVTTHFPSLESKSLRMSYRIARGEQGVLSFEPYKSLILPCWRFRTPAIARESSTALWSRFLEYDSAGDFVGMDMTRKFIQMGMTRAKRYANYKGGKKYVDGKQLEKSEGHEGKADKQEASDIFKEVWQRCREHRGYLMKKEEFMKEQKDWDKAQKKVGKAKMEGKVENVKLEED